MKNNRNHIIIRHSLFNKTAGYGVWKWNIRHPELDPLGWAVNWSDTGFMSNILRQIRKFNFTVRVDSSYCKKFYKTSQEDDQSCLGTDFIYNTINTIITCQLWFKQTFYNKPSIYHINQVTVKTFMLDRKKDFPLTDHTLTNEVSFYFLRKITNDRIGGNWCMEEFFSRFDEENDSGTTLEVMPSVAP